MSDLGFLDIPASRAALDQLQSMRKRAAVERAMRSPFMRSRLSHISLDDLDDPEVWNKIPILDKEELRSISDETFYESFCHRSHDGVAEYWRSGGSTGRPLFYPRSHADISAAQVSFARAFACVGLTGGARAHNSFPLGIHPAGQMFARSAAIARIAMTWAGAGTTTPSSLQLDLIQRLRPTVWIGMPSYALHLATLAATQGIDLAGSSVATLMCSAEPLSGPKRAKLRQR
jgi:phenylacetate-CoA ligase